jgi:hypothetical protein
VLADVLASHTLLAGVGTVAGVHSVVVGHCCR